MFDQEQPVTNWDILEQIAAADVPMLSQSSEDDYIAEETKVLVRVALESLTPRERQIIEQRFGFNGYDEMTLKDVGNALGLTRERIRQIEAKTLSNLRSDSKFLTIRDGSFQISVRVHAKRPDSDKKWSKYQVEKAIAKIIAAKKAKSKAEADALFLSRAIALAERERASRESRRLEAERKIVLHEMDADLFEIEAVSLEKSAADYNNRACDNKLQQRKNNQFAGANRIKAKHRRERAARLRYWANCIRETWQIPIKQYIPKEIVPRPDPKPIITPPRSKPRPRPEPKPEPVYYKSTQANLNRPPTAKTRQQALAEQKNAADRDFRAKVEQLRYAQD